MQEISELVVQTKEFQKSSKEENALKSASVWCWPKTAIMKSKSH